MNSPHSRKPVFGEALTPRELEIMEKIADGLSNREIRREGCISEKTVKHHIGNIFGKTGLTSRTQIVKTVAEAMTACSVQRAERELAEKILALFPVGCELEWTELRGVRETISGIVNEQQKLTLNQLSATMAVELFLNAVAKRKIKAETEGGKAVETEPQRPPHSHPAATIPVHAEEATP